MNVAHQAHERSSNTIVPVAWRQVPVRRAKSRAVRILWNPRFLKTVLDGGSNLSLRSPKTKPTGPIVLADMLIMGDETVSIEGKLLVSEKKPKQKRYTLQMRLLVPIPPHTRVRVTLRWGDQNYPAVFENGTAFIENLPPITKAQAQTDEPIPGFSLTLDFDGTPPEA